MCNNLLNFRRTITQHRIVQCVLTLSDSTIIIDRAAVLSRLRMFIIVLMSWSMMRPQSTQLCLFMAGLPSQCIRIRSISSRSSSDTHADHAASANMAVRSRADVPFRRIWIHLMRGEAMKVSIIMLRIASSEFIIRGARFAYPFARSKNCCALRLI